MRWLGMRGKGESGFVRHKYRKMVTPGGDVFRPQFSPAVRQDADVTLHVRNQLYEKFFKHGTFLVGKGCHEFLVHFTHNRK